ncbi:MAG: Hpt domain-containing protein [Bacteroidales bacterium]|nr:Hpt domain-containing protein [Bacteroidales bacterium]
MIDRHKFNENFQYFEKEIIVEIIDIFESEYNERYKNLRENIQNKDFVQLKFNAHSLKGVIANFMDPVTVELSRELDEKAKNKEELGLVPLFDELEKQSGVLRAELKRIKEELTA